MVNKTAYKMGKIVGKRVVEIAGIKKEKKRESALYSTAIALRLLGKGLEMKISDKSVLSSIRNDIKLGIDAGISEFSSYQERETKNLYQKLLHILGL